MTWNSRAIPHRHLKQTCAYRRDWQTEHKCLSAAPKLAELVKVVLWINPEIEIVGNHGEPKRRVQNAGNMPPSQGHPVITRQLSRCFVRRVICKRGQAYSELGRTGRTIGNRWVRELPALNGTLERPPSISRNREPLATASCSHTIVIEFYFTPELHLTDGRIIPPWPLRAAWRLWRGLPPAGMTKRWK
jgi:hypothetical protein